MEYKVGEKIRFLHENMEGVIQEIHGRKVIVLVDDFDDLEVSMDEIVKIHHAEPDKDKIGVKPKAPPRGPKPRHSQHPQLAITRAEGGKYNLILVNPTEMDMLFTAFSRIRSKTIPLNASGIKSGATRLLGRLSSDEFHQLRSVLIQLLYYQDEAFFNPKAPSEFEVEVRMENLDKKMELIPRLKAEGWLYPLKDKPEELKAETTAEKKLFEYKGMKLDQSPPPSEVDLHIEKLSTDHLKMDSGEMMQLQIKTFRDTMSKAISFGSKKIVFIHGSGKGILKSEIEMLLRGYSEVRQIQTADQMKYGLGATEVIFH